MDKFAKLSSGDMPAAVDWNRLTSIATAVSSITARGMTVSMTRSGMSLSTNQGVMRFQEPAQIAIAENIGDSDFAPLDVAQLTWPFSLQETQEKAGHSGNPLRPETHTGARTLEIIAMQDSCFGRFCVCAQEIKRGASGYVYIGGVCLCHVARGYGVYKPGATFRFPDRADTIRGQKYLQLSEVGAAQVLWLYGTPSGKIEAVPAVIRFDSRNTTGIGIWEYGNLDNRGVAEVLEFDQTVDIKMLYPGVLKLDKHEGV